MKAYLLKQKKLGLLDFIPLVDQRGYLVLSKYGFSEIKKRGGKAKEDYFYGEYANTKKLERYKNKYLDYVDGLDDIGIYNTREEYEKRKAINEFLNK